MAKANDYFQNHDFSKLIISKNDFLSIVDKADKIRLYDDKRWLNLLHINGKKSEITNEQIQIQNIQTNEILTSAGFFYAKDGYKNPQKELYENLFEIFVKKDFYKGLKAVYNQEKSALIFDGDEDNLHFRCRFLLRYDFLKSSLHLQEYEDIECDDYKKFINYIEPKSLSVVFPAAYLNSPASMFGHSFLTIQSKYNSKLLSYAINWAADVDENKENPIKFMFYGVFGGYDGKYSITPYYDMLKTYKDNENRDLYEYSLKLSDEELDRLLKHLWEIKDTKSNYYFFTQNCSYNLLWLLENAKDGLSLRDEFFYTVAPSKTIQKMEEKGLIIDYSYRPSKLNLILSQQKDLNYNEINLAKNIAKGSILPDEVKNHKNEYKILALANELSLYYAIKQKITKNKYQKITHDISSHLAKAKIQNLNHPNKKTSIIKSNYPFRFALAYKYDSFYKNQALINLRPSMHTLDEDDEGFERGIGVEFFNTFLSIDKKIRLERFNLIQLYSLSDFNIINHIPSYTLALKYDDILGKNKANAKGMIGFSYINDNVLLSYLMGAKGYDGGISFDNTLMFSLSYKANKLSLEYNKNFYKHNKSEDKASINFHAKLYKNFAYFLKLEHTTYHHLSNPYKDDIDNCSFNGSYKCKNQSISTGFYYYF